ncbi:MAG: hypothetical protein KatS3mg055_1169 [Chloroflexus sp.]|uniref:hypothetical protein n=1 Tax=Chloroflexus sp. TaxID=1904827 RepID=UPI0021DCAAD9|nr:hypothetical protein [Chloroflexus sp.]GIV88651.1 MAG: hypothetical protein KatS3mg055_1169 [Chloroflexus sp.]
MLNIVNPKIAGFTPRWATFRGLTILFDNIGLRRDGPWLRLDCALDAIPEYTLYRGLRKAMCVLDTDLLLRRYLFCALPPSTYHVTLWDGPSDGNSDQALPHIRPRLDDLLIDVPGALLHGHFISGTVAGSPLIRRKGWRVGFTVSQLAIVHRSALVALLSPTAETRNTFAMLVELRSSWNATFRQRFGIAAYEPYAPHVTLGYFADPALADEAQAEVPYWEEVVLQQTAGTQITFVSASLYGLLDMVTFFRTVR